MTTREHLDIAAQIDTVTEGNVHVGPRSGTLVGNLGEPLKLSGFELHGVTAESPRPGERVKVWTRLAMTSDEPAFHRIVESLSRVITHHAGAAGLNADASRANNLLLVIHKDNTADLWIDSAAVIILALAKRDMQAGSAVFESDIGDVTEMRFPAVEILPTDRLLYLFRQDWRFGLFFDLRTDGNLSIDDTARTLGSLYRRMRYSHLYDMLNNEAVFSKLIQSGWFPFVEIIGSEFNALLEACQADFDLSEAGNMLLAKFDDTRIDRIFARWLAKPHFVPRRPILEASIRAFKAREPVAVLKIILTEIEGILADAYRVEVGQNAKIKTLLRFAVETAEKKAGGPDTLLFPTAFARYLDSYTYANFDRALQNGAAGSRHAVGHGAAKPESYTQIRALQALLTLDQIAFYT